MSRRRDFCTYCYGYVIIYTCSTFLLFCCAVRTHVRRQQMEAIDGGLGQQLRSVYRHTDLRSHR